MCVSSCGGIFTDGVRLDKVTCPCGHGYWDVWKAAFVSGDEIRAKKAPPKEEYVARVERAFSLEEYEAKIMQQYVYHFLECKEKRALDDKATREGKNDGSTLRRALTFLWEYNRRDFKSKGTSQHLDTNTLKATWSRLRGSSVTEDDIRPLLAQKSFPVDTKDAGDRDITSAPLTAFNQVTVARHSSISDQTPRLAAAAGTEGSYRNYFIPQQAIRQDVLDHHCKKGTFGQGAVAQPHRLEDGRHGFSVRSSIAPTVESIRLLGEDSKKVDEAERKSSKSTGRTTEDDQHQSSRHQNTSVGGSPSRHTSATTTRSMDTMIVSSTTTINSSTDRRQKQYNAPSPGTVGRSAQSPTLAYSQSAQRHEARHSRHSRDSIDDRSPPPTYLESHQRLEPGRSRYKHEISDEQDNHRSVDDEPAAEKGHRTDQLQRTTVQWLCCRCDEDPQAWPNIKRCVSCGHARCKSCGEENKTSTPAAATTTHGQDTEDSSTESPPDPPARATKDNTGRSSKTDRHYDKKKDSRDRRH